MVLGISHQGRGVERRDEVNPKKGDKGASTRTEITGIFGVKPQGERFTRTSKDETSRLDKSVKEGV